MNFFESINAYEKRKSDIWKTSLHIHNIFIYSQNKKSSPRFVPKSIKIFFLSLSFVATFTKFIIQQGSLETRQDARQESAKVYLFFPIRLYLGPVYHFSFFPSFFDAGCQWPVPRNGDVPWNQFFLPHPSPPTFYSGKLGSSAVCGTEEHSRTPCAHCQTTHPERPSLFPPYFPQDLYPWVCGRLLFRIPWYTSLTYARGILDSSFSLSGRHWNLCLQISSFLISPPSRSEGWN